MHVVLSRDITHQHAYRGVVLWSHFLVLFIGVLLLCLYFCALCVDNCLYIGRLLFFISFIFRVLPYNHDNVKTRKPVINFMRSKGFFGFIFIRNTNSRIFQRRYSKQLNSFIILKDINKYPNPFQINFARGTWKLNFFLLSKYINGKF